MIWLGLLTTLAFVPGWTGYSIPTGWAALAIVLPWFLWRRANIGPLHWLGLGFLGYAVASLAWAPRFDDGVFHLAKLAILGMAFYIGSARVSLNSLWTGIALGAVISVTWATVQWWCIGNPSCENLGQLIHYGDSGKPSGLFYNSTVLGAVCVLVLIVRPISAPIMLWGIWLSGSRGALVALAAVLFCWSFDTLWHWSTRRLIKGVALVWAAGTLSLATAFALWWGATNPHDVERLVLWKVVWSQLTFFGSGAGALQDVYYIARGVFIQPEYAHNEFLDLGFHFGVGAVPLFLLLAVLLRSTWAYGWPILFCGLVLALYSWPLHHPITVLILGAAAGNIAREWTIVWDFRHKRGYDLLSRLTAKRPSANRSGCGTVPVQLASEGKG